MRLRIGLTQYFPSRTHHRFQLLRDLDLSGQMYSGSACDLVHVAGWEPAVIACTIKDILPGLDMYHK